MNYPTTVLAGDDRAHRASVHSLLGFGMVGSQLRCMPADITLSVPVVSSASARKGACVACHADAERTRVLR